MKRKPSIRKRCKKCRLIQRNGVKLIVCTIKKHKQKQGK